ncbi:Small ribosomal subunit protein eS25x [Ranunculus cassubicifolius]
MVLFDQASYDKLLSEVPKYKLITPSILSGRLRVNGSLARRAIKDLMAKGAIRMISAHAASRFTPEPPTPKRIYGLNFEMLSSRLLSLKTFFSDVGFCFDY